VKAVERFGQEGPVDRWKRLRAEVHEEVCREGFDAERNTFVQSYGSDILDASLLMIPLVGFLPARDPRVEGTVDAIQRGLCDDGFVLRYPIDDEVAEVDGLPPGEGAFGLATCWLVDALALAGRVDEARGLFEHVAGCANHVGLLAEQIEPGSRALMGNFPQAFTHLGLINSALYLAAAERRRTAGPPPFGVATPPSAAPAAAPP
jgi:GH15 family glucan-1,4-alpha-glucosidase